MAPTQLIYNWPFHVVIALAAAALALTVSFAAAMRRGHLMPARLVRQLETLIDRGEYKQATDLCESRSGCLCRIVGSGLSEMHGGLDSMLTASGNACEKEAKMLERRLRWLLLIGILAPPVGFAATVVALARTFGAVASMGEAATPADLAEGLSAAPLPLSVSALVMLFSLLAYALFRMRATGLVLHIGSVANGLLTRVRPRD